MASYSYTEVYVLTAAGDGTGVYTSSTPIIPGSLVGKTVITAGFAEGANNATCVVSANSDCTITTNNSSSVAETHAGTATVKVVSITSTTPFNNQDAADMLAKLSAIDYLLPAVSYTSPILTITLADTRVLRFYFTSGAGSILIPGVLAGTTYALASVAAGTGVYTGTIGAVANTLKGSIAVIDGFTAPADNGAFVVTANNGSTTLTTTNLLSEAETTASTATLATVTADKWDLHDLKKFLDFAEVARRMVARYAITAFTVAYV